MQLSDDVTPCCRAPQGPAYAGFRSGFDEEHSFLGIERPFLFVTGGEIELNRR